METINEYNKAIVDILRNTINNPEELDEFNKDVEDTMDCASDDEEFLRRKDRRGDSDAKG